MVKFPVGSKVKLKSGPGSDVFRTVTENGMGFVFVSPGFFGKVVSSIEPSKLEFADEKEPVAYDAMGYSL